MTRAPPSEKSFSSVIVHDLNLRIDDHYTADDLLNVTMLRCKKYLRGLDQISKERKQPIRESEFAKPLFDFIDHHRHADSSWLLQQVIQFSKHFSETGTMPEHTGEGITWKNKQTQ